MQRTFTCFNDPAHGWIKVPKKVLEKLGIAEKVSSYSYQRGEYAYLEEDCDATLLISAMREHGFEPKFIDLYTDKSSKIRSYAYYEYAPTPNI